MAGYIHLYTGNGKGKTTAALGLALRAAGAGKRVYIAQFVKGMHYSELESVKRIPAIQICQFGLDCFIVNEPTGKDIDAAREGLTAVGALLDANGCDVLILDEICIALHYHLFELEDAVALLQRKPPDTEIILTGRYAPPELYELADLVTEMIEIKHYYQTGIEARAGIEF
jgi:cob(I)alamin adenosyltransferase